MTDSLIGSQFAAFQILSRIKPGGMAIVYKAYDQNRRQEVALKILQESLALHEEIVRRFRQEASIVEKLRHKYIVQFYDFGEYQSRLYIAMQYVSGGSLADLLARNPRISLGRTAEMLKQIASALDYAHHKNVVHRDLKLGNILLNETGEALLTDFGIARVLTETEKLTMTGQQMPGTVKYMSPEQAMGNTELDYRSDLYSFAVIGYLLSTGRYPFTGTSDIVIINQHLNMKPPEPQLVNPDLPATLEAVLLKGMAKQPENRYESAGDFAAAFEQAVVGYEPLEVTVNLRADNPVQVYYPPTTFEHDSEPGTTNESAGTHSSTLLFNTETKEAARRNLWMPLAVIGAFTALALFVVVNGSLNAPLPPTATAEVAAVATTADPVIPSPTASPTRRATRVSSAPLVNATDTPVSSTPTITDPTATPSRTPSATIAATRTDTLTFTASPTPTPLFTELETFAAAFQSMGTMSQFDCRAFVEVYEFIDQQSEDSDSTFTPVSTLIDEPEDPLRQIYDQVCALEPQNTQAQITYTLFSDMLEAVDELTVTPGITPTGSTG